MITLAVGEICELKYGSSLPERARESGDVPVYGSNGPVGFHSEALTDGPAIIVGRKGSIGQIRYSPRPCWPIDTTYFIDQSATKHDLRWLSYALSGLRLEELNKATGVPGLNRNDAYAKLLYVPPIEEQRRIAAILDQADDLRRKRREAIEKLSSLATAVVTEMFGELESSAQKTIKLKDYVEILVGFPFQSERYIGEHGGIRLCRGANILPDRIDWSDTVYWPKAEIDQYKKFKLQADDVLIAMDRPWISEGFKVARLSSEDTPSLLVQRVARLRPSNPSASALILELLKGSAFAKHFRPTETTVPHISPNEIREFEMPLPNDKQLEEAGVQLGRIDHLKARHRAHLAKLDALFASLQHRAFRGEL